MRASEGASRAISRVDAGLSGLEVVAVLSIGARSQVAQRADLLLQGRQPLACARCLGPCRSDLVVHRGPGRGVLCLAFVKRLLQRDIERVVGVILAIFIGIVNIFLLPAEEGNIYAKANLDKPVSGVTGFWVLIPIVGWFIWLYKVQTAINTRWESLGVVKV